MKWSHSRARAFLARPIRRQLHLVHFIVGSSWRTNPASSSDNASLLLSFMPVASALLFLLPVAACCLFPTAPWLYINNTVDRRSTSGGSGSGGGRSSGDADSGHGGSAAVKARELERQGAEESRPQIFQLGLSDQRRPPTPPSTRWLGVVRVASPQADVSHSNHVTAVSHSNHDRGKTTSYGEAVDDSANWSSMTVA